MNKDIISYYNDRAKEYDQVYLNPLEQEDLSAATQIFQTLFSNKTVLEIACGTGYWTERIAQVATSVDATDINEQVLAIAKGKTMRNHVTFSIADMYTLKPDKKYDAVFGGFIWSHILLQDLDQFIDQLKSMLKPGGMVVFIDSNPLENTFHDPKRITHIDEYGNTYQTRMLDNGSTHQVLKNFPSKEFLWQKLSKLGADLHFTNLTHYWIISCKAFEAQKH